MNELAAAAASLVTSAGANAPEREVAPIFLAITAAESVMHGAAPEFGLPEVDAGPELGATDFEILAGVVAPFDAAEFDPHAAANMVSAASAAITAVRVRT